MNDLMHNPRPDKHGPVFLELCKKEPHPVPCKKGIRCSVRYCASGHWASYVLQGTRNARPYITGHSVFAEMSYKCL